MQNKICLNPFTVQTFNASVENSFLPFLQKRVNLECKFKFQSRCFVLFFYHVLQMLGVLQLKVWRAPIDDRRFVLERLLVILELIQKTSSRFWARNQSLISKLFINLSDEMRIQQVNDHADSRIERIWQKLNHPLSNGV